ncbi:amidohydrolase family protein [Actinomycetota bacterium]
MSDRLALYNGTVIDGSGAPPFVGSVAIENGRISAIGPEAELRGGPSLDVGGLAVSPGFIDMHTHSDVSVLSDPDCVSAVGQGVTSQIVGHCGFSAAPTNELTRSSLAAEEPVFGFPARDGVSPGEWGWAGVGDYLEAVAAAQPRTNIGTLVGHNTVRRLVIGTDNRPATATEVGRMADLVGEGLDDGALGVSSGLSYVPGVFAGRDELISLARVASSRGRRYHTHMRYGESSVRESLLEALETARRGDCPVNVSHLYPTTADDLGAAPELLELIETARGGGVDVTFDLTLFRRGGGAWLQSLPLWARDGGVAATVERIRDRATRQQLITEVQLRYQERDWDDDLIVKVNRPENAGLVGRSIGAVAAERGVDPAVAALSLVAEDGQFWIAPTIKRQPDLDLLLRQSTCVPVTDGMAAHPERHAHLGLMPKTFGTFPLLFGDYVRERGVLELAEAVSRVTSLPADRMGLSDRGRLAAGYRADIVVFDPATIANRATDVRPGLPPAGVHHVMVNGAWAVRDGKLTSERNGEVLK